MLVSPLRCQMSFLQAFPGAFLEHRRLDVFVEPLIFEVKGILEEQVLKLKIQIWLVLFIRIFQNGSLS